MLAERVAPIRLMTLALSGLPREDTEQNVQLALELARRTFWRFLPSTTRSDLAPQLEAVLLAGLSNAGTSSLKAAWFDAFRATVTTPDGTAFLERVWRRDEQIEGLVFSETDEAEMALELAVRGGAGAQAILDAQLARFVNPDRRARFEFVLPALSANGEVRDAFFASLEDPANRRREPWVVEGLEYLNHPLRAESAETHLRPALELLPEIRRTGDIFFPTNWTNAVLAGHNTSDAARIVREFLDERPELPDALRRVVLQSAHELFQASRIVRADSTGAAGVESASD
jgi:aminopeptidase N